MDVTRSEAIGRLLIIALDEARWTTAGERLLARCRPGGVLLFGHFSETAHATAELLRKIALTTGSPPFLILEEEGGAADPLRRFLPPWPSARAATRKGVSAVERLGELIGAALRLLGFNTNLAPTLDLAALLHKRRFRAQALGADPAEVSRSGDAFVRGLRKHGVLACGKRFPAFGPAATESKDALPISGKPMAELWREDLVPFRRLLPQLPMVLISHAAYKAFDFDLPCSAGLSSRVVEGLLRVRLGYRGLAMAERLEEEGIRGSLELGEAVIHSVNAGCDLLLVRGAKNAELALAGLQQGLESGKLSAARVEQSLKRIRLVQKSLRAPRGRVSRRRLDQLARQFEAFSRDLEPEEQKFA